MFSGCRRATASPRPALPAHVPTTAYLSPAPTSRPCTGRRRLRPVREMSRVARPGAPVAACFWDDEEMPLLRSCWDACRAVVPAALASVSEQAQVGLADIGALRDWWTGAGLREVALASSRYPPSTRASTISGSRSRPASVTQARSTSRSTVSSSGRYTPTHTVGSDRRRVGFAPERRYEPFVVGATESRLLSRESREAVAATPAPIRPSPEALNHAADGGLVRLESWP